MSPTASRRHALTLGGLGAVTGLVTWALVEYVADWLGSGGDAVAWIGPGLVYGLVVAVYVNRIAGPSPARLAWLVVGMMASWNLAVRTASALYNNVDSEVAAGAVAGAVGATIVAGAAALADPAWRRPWDAVLLVPAGAVCGLLLSAGVEGNVALYVVWQGAIAALLGAGLDRAGR